MGNTEAHGRNVCATRIDGIAEQVGSRWRLTKSGRAMFGAFVLELDSDDERQAGHEGLPGGIPPRANAGIP